VSQCHELNEQRRILPRVCTAVVLYRVKNLPSHSGIHFLGEVHARFVAELWWTVFFCTCTLKMEAIRSLETLVTSCSTTRCPTQKTTLHIFTAVQTSHPIRTVSMTLCVKLMPQYVPGLRLNPVPGLCR
jgi:hypothetical protein